MLQLKNSCQDDKRPPPDNDDYSNTCFINKIWIVKEPLEIIEKVSIYLPVIIIGIFGNILVIYVLIKNRHLRTPTNLMIGNMALADFLSLLIHPWVFLITYDIYQFYELGDFGCQSEAALECSILISSVFSLSVISYDRLTCIVLPKESGLTLIRVKYCIVLSWITGFILSSPLVIFRTYKERQWKDILEKYCSENPIIFKIYWPLIITVLVWLPLSILIICYISIFFKLKKFECTVLKNMDHKRKVSYKKKVVIMMFIVIMTFMVCRLPFTAYIFYRYTTLSGKSPSIVGAVDDKGFDMFWFLSKYLIFVNAALNPIIYGVTNEKFRKAFRNTKLSNWLFCNNDSKLLSTSSNKKYNLKSTENIFFIFKKKIRSKEGITCSKIVKVEDM